MNIEDLNLSPEAEQTETPLAAEEALEPEMPTETTTEESVTAEAAEETAAENDTQEPNAAATEKSADKANRATFRKFVEAKNLMGALNRLAGHNGSMAEAMRARGRIIALLKLKDGVSTNDMAQILGISRATLNEALAKLAEKNLVAFETVEDDQRTQLVRLTEAGKEARIPENLPDCLFTDFDDNELATFEAYLDRVIENVKNELGSDLQRALDEQRAEQKPPFEKGGRDRKPGDRGGRDDRGFRGGRDERSGRDGRGFRERDERGGRGRDDRDGRGGFGGRGRDDRGRDDRGGRGNRGFGNKGRNDRSGRGGFGGRDRNDRGGRGGFGGRGRDDRRGHGERSDRW